MSPRRDAPQNVHPQTPLMQGWLKTARSPNKLLLHLNFWRQESTPSFPHLTAAPRGKPPLGALHSSPPAPPQTPFFLRNTPKGREMLQQTYLLPHQTSYSPPAQPADYLRGLYELMQPTWPHTWFPTMELIPIAIQGGKSQPQCTPPALPTTFPRNTVQMGQIWGGRAETWAGT